MNDEIRDVVLDAEQAVLGSVMIDGKWLDELRAIGLSETHFHRHAHRPVFRALGRLIDAGIDPDVVTMRDELSKAGELEAAGGWEYLRLLEDAVPAAAHALHYARIVLRASQTRDYSAFADECKAMIYDTPDPEERLAKTCQRIAELQAQARSFEPRTYFEIGTDVHEWLKDNDAPTDLMLSGLPKLDDLIGAIPPQKVIVIAGDPSSGKTVLAMQIAQIWARQHCICGILSVETPQRDLVIRVLSNDANIHSGNMRAKALAEKDYSALAAVMNKPEYNRLYIDDRPDVSESNLTARIRSLSLHQHCNAIVIDYLQLIPSRGDDRRLGIDRMINACKSMAKELNLRIIVISQLSREGRLKESSGINAAADVILTIRRETSSGEQKTRLVVEKARDGRQGGIDLWFTPFQFTERAPDGDV